MEQNDSSINVNYSARDNALRLMEAYLSKWVFANSVYIWIISVIEIPMMLLTLFALCFLIKSRHAASVYVTHLILSDLVQIICVLLLSTRYLWRVMLECAHLYSLIVGLYFMACIAFERYLLVSHPIWYRSHHSVKFSCLISVIVWFVPLIFATIRSSELYFIPIDRAIACFIPYPIIILCFVGTCRGLSHSISLTSHKRKFILGSLSLVLLNYTFLILPFSIMNAYCHINYDVALYDLTFVKIDLLLNSLLYLNPLVDCILYFFMRSDAGDIMKSFQCCRRSDTHQNTVRYTTNPQHHNV